MAIRLRIDCGIIAINKLALKGLKILAQGEALWNKDDLPLALKGQKTLAQGEALWNNGNLPLALKGRKNLHSKYL